MFYHAQAAAISFFLLPFPVNTNLHNKKTAIITTKDDIN